MAVGSTKPGWQVALFGGTPNPPVTALACAAHDPCLRRSECNCTGSPLPPCLPAAGYKSGDGCDQSGTTFSRNYGQLPTCSAPTPHWPSTGKGVIMSYVSACCVNERATAC